MLSHRQQDVKEAVQRLYLPAQVDAAQRRHLAVPVFPEHLAHGAGGRLAGDTVDVDPLVLVFLAHQLLLLLLLGLHSRQPAKKQSRGFRKMFQ